MLEKAERDREKAELEVRVVAFEMSTNVYAQILYLMQRRMKLLLQNDL